MIFWMQLWTVVIWYTRILYVCSAKSKVQGSACSPFPYAELENGKIVSMGAQKYAFECDRGYFLASPKKVRCYKGKWSSVQKPKCLKPEGQCDDPPAIKGGEILGEERHVGSVIQYLCKQGFIMQGDRTRTCLQSGYWSGVEPYCMDESEPLQKVAERFKDNFLTDVGSYSSDSSVVKARLLDRESTLKGLELVILIDRSSSVDPMDFKMGVNFVKFLLHQFGVRNGNNANGTRAAVMAFGSNVNILFNLDNYTITSPYVADIALDTLQPEGGSTAMEEALTNVFTRLSPVREQAKKAIFMITDGVPDVGTEENTQFFAKELRNDKGFEIFSVGIGKGINREFLGNLSSKPLHSHVFILDRYSDLEEIMETVRDESTIPPPISSDRCGYIPLKEHYLKRWPWLAAVYVNLQDEYNSTRMGFCSGTLICSQWVVTAASCFFSVHVNGTEKSATVSTEEVFVSLGERYLVHEDRNQMNFYAESVFLHPDFNALQELENNVALIRLNEPAPAMRFRPACLPNSERPVPLHLDLNANVSIAGWGRPQHGERLVHEVSGSTVRLRSFNVSVALEEESVCSAFSGAAAHSSVFCAGGLGSQTCIGDLGSPIIAVDPFTNLHHLLGVLSKKSNCQQGINQYADLTKHMDWIDRITDNCHNYHYTA